MPILSWNYKIKKREEYEMEIVFGGIAFAVLFAAWVIIPSIVKKRHSEEEVNEV